MEFTSSHDLFHYCFTENAVAAVSIDIGFDHWCIEQMIGIRRGDHHDRNFAGQPGGIVSQTEGNIPVQAQGGIIRSMGILDSHQ